MLSPCARPQGTVPEAWAYSDSVNNMASLQMLELYGNQLTGSLPQFPYAPNIVTLDLFSEWPLYRHAGLSYPILLSNHT